MSKRREDSLVIALAHMERWGTLVWRLARTACADQELACAAFTRTFVQWYQRADRLRHFPGEQWLAAALAVEACALLTAGNAGPGPAASNHGELTETDPMEALPEAQLAFPYHAVPDGTPAPPASTLVQAVQSLPAVQRQVWLTYVFGWSDPHASTGDAGGEAPAAPSAETPGPRDSSAYPAESVGDSSQGRLAPEPAPGQPDGDVWVALSRVLLLPVAVVRQHLQAAVELLQAYLACPGKRAGACEHGVAGGASGEPNLEGDSG
ncbi:MAG: hypothetical protein K6T31_11355, partial [Alicyclobacillus sp.]|nr:hypothetical protein [Alicyclobacillus sp.]